MTSVWVRRRKKKKNVEFTSPQCFGSTKNYGRYKTHENRGFHCFLNGCKKIITRNLPTNSVVRLSKSVGGFFLSPAHFVPMSHFVAFLDHSQLSTRPVGERVFSTSQRPLLTKHTPPQWVSNPWFHESRVAYLHFRLCRHRDRQCRN